MSYEHKEKRNPLMVWDPEKSHGHIGVSVGLYEGDDPNLKGQFQSMILGTMEDLVDALKDAGFKKTDLIKIKMKRSSEEAKSRYTVSFTMGKEYTGESRYDGNDRDSGRQSRPRDDRDDRDRDEGRGRSDRRRDEYDEVDDRRDPPRPRNADRY